MVGSNTQNIFPNQQSDVRTLFQCSSWEIVMMDRMAGQTYSDTHFSVVAAKKLKNY
jgi:hypothetical protein